MSYACRATMASRSSNQRGDYFSRCRNDGHGIRRRPELLEHGATPRCSIPTFYHPYTGIRSVRSPAGIVVSMRTELLLIPNLGCFSWTMMNTANAVVDDFDLDPASSNLPPFATVPTYNANGEQSRERTCFGSR